MIGIAAGNRALLVFDSVGGSGRTLSMPDSLRLLGIAASPNGDSAAAFVASATATYFGTTPLTDWRFRALLREAGQPQVATLTWARDGYVYFARWDGAARTPILVRVNAARDAKTAEAPERVMGLPERCAVQTVTIAIGARRGACLAPDFRGDVYLARVPGLAR